MKLSALVILFLLVGCSAPKLVKKSEESYQSRMVYHPSYGYQGVYVNNSTNWLLGKGKGLGGKSRHKIDFEVSGLGKIYKLADEERKQNQLKHDQGLISETLSDRNQFKTSQKEMPGTLRNDAKNSSCTLGEEPDKNRPIGKWVLYYETNKLNPNNFEKLKSDLVRYNPTKVFISGHTDDVGSDEYNFELSKKRALQAKDMISNIWMKSDYDIRWGGECPRAVMNIDDVSRSLNRRVVITAYDIPLNNTAFNEVDI